MRRTVKASHVRCRTRRTRPDGEAAKSLAIALTAFRKFLLAKEATHYEPGTMRVKWAPDEREPMLPCRIAVGVASAYGPQEEVHGTIADLAAMFEAFFHRVPEVEPDQDA